MAGRKLQAEIDRVLKKVAEGSKDFEGILAKVNSATSSNQKEKYEIDLKKTIKKLQRYRDQIKTWCQSNAIKDKRALVEARKLIEGNMEKFKVCEKEMKTKAYSNLALQTSFNSADDPYYKTKQWIKESLETLKTQIDTLESKLEGVQAATAVKKQTGGKGRNAHHDQQESIERLRHSISRHRFHEDSLEHILRKLDNETITGEQVDEIRDGVEYYIEQNQEEDFCEDEELYDELISKGDLLSPRDRSDNEEGDEDSGETTAKTEEPETPAVSAPVPAEVVSTPITIQPAAKATAVATAPAKVAQAPREEPVAKKAATVNAKQAAAAAAAASAAASSPTSAAASASAQHTETEKTSSESESANKRTLTQTRSTGATAVVGRQAHTNEANQRQVKHEEPKPVQHAEPVVVSRPQPEIQRGPESNAGRANNLKTSRGNITLEPVPTPAPAVSAQPVSPRYRQGNNLPVMPALNMAAEAVEDSKNNETFSMDFSEDDISMPSTLADLASATLEMDAVPGGSGSRNLLSPVHEGMHQQFGQPQQFAQQSGQLAQQPIPFASELDMLEASLENMPDPSDSERPRQYFAQNPYPTPAFFPQNPSPIFDNQALFEKFDTDTLFFIFYYQQGTYQQFLAARELKKQSWRYHKKYLTWFQRHEEPKEITNDHEQGTYVYFDYETGWCQRKKTEFTFEYRYLEEETL